MNLQVALKYGGISGGLIALSFFTGPMISDYGIGEILGYAVMLLALSAVFIGLKNFRDKTLGGLMTFKQGFINGMGIILIASIIYVIGWMIYMPNFQPDFADKYYAAQIENVQQNADLSSDEKATKIESMNASLENYKKPHIMAAYTFMEIFPVGLIVTLIASLVLKRKKAR